MNRQKIAVIGSGIAGLSAAWLLAKRHNVTLFEADSRLGGHSNTVTLERGALRLLGPASQPCAVDTGFIVYNPPAYPNLVALFEHLGVATAPSNMSFSVTRGDGQFEYSGSGLPGLFGQTRNLVSARHWRLTADILKFFHVAQRELQAEQNEQLSLAELLAEYRFGDAFINDHILPMGAAIWSTPARDMLDFPAAAFLRFFANHGLLQARNRPRWRTVKGGSKHYVKRLVRALSDIRLSTPIDQITRRGDEVFLRSKAGERFAFDHVVIASHADQTLAMLSDVSPEEQQILSRFSYAESQAVLHGDERFMPNRRRLWSSWNYKDRAASGDAAANPCITYWMNRLQPLTTDRNLFVTLNPQDEIAKETVLRRFSYAHPMFDAGAMAAQKALWSLQGQRRTWFCGSYFGYGFHEDGLQSGLAVAEQLGGVRRPWDLAEPNTRLHLPATLPNATTPPVLEAAQ